MPQQLPHHIEAGAPRRHVNKGRTPKVVSGFDLSAGSDQQLNDLKIAPPASKMEGSKAIPVLRSRQLGRCVEGHLNLLALAKCREAQKR